MDHLTALFNSLIQALLPLGDIPLLELTQKQTDNSTEVHPTGDNGISDSNRTPLAERTNIAEREL